MELKYKIRIMEKVKLIVLIVPLWNWNYIDSLNIDKIGRSNRTFMELK